MNQNHFMLLAADIGGTNSRFALFEVSPATSGFPHLRLCNEQWLETKDFSSFAALLQGLKQSNLAAYLDNNIKLAAIGAPGPVEGQFCYPPNIAWNIDSLEVNRKLGIKNVYLLNDFTAQGYGCLLARSPQSRGKFDVKEIWAGEKALPGHHGLPSAPLAIVGAGSGLGKALILESPPVVLPSEGGHGIFAFEGRQEFEYAEFLYKKHNTDSIHNDIVLSGEGLADLYEFHAQLRLSARQVTTLFENNESKNHASLIALEWYARFYGRVCKNFVLDTMALSGLYITGGMAARIPVLDHPAFLQSLQHSYDQNWLLKKIPVYHIQSQQAGLRGAALFGVLQNCAQQ